MPIRALASPAVRDWQFAPWWFARCLRLALLICAVSGVGAASGQVIPGGLGTRVNGTALGRCGQGVCTVQGGTGVGSTLFHRFSQFDTRSGIQRVDLDTGGRRNVVVGVSHPSGSFFGAPLRLSQAASLFWLSPGGLWLGSGSQVLGAANLLLSTAPSLRLGGGEFKAVAGLRDGLGPLIDPSAFSLNALSQGGLQGAELGVGDGPIVLAGGRLQVDRHLLLDSGAGAIRSLPGTVSDLRAGGDLRLSGGDLLLRGLAGQAGSTLAESGVWLRAAALAGVGQGRLELADTQLRGPSLGLEGSTIVMDSVGLQAGELLVRSAGSLHATALRARAEGAGGSGHLQLTAAAAAAGASLRLERSELEGQALVIGAAGPSELRQVQARSGRDGQPGGIWLRSQPGPGGAASPIVLERVGLRGDPVVVVAAGDLRGRELEVEAGALWLRGQAREASPGHVSLQGGALAAASLDLQADADLALRELGAEAEAIRLAATQRLSIDRSQLQATGAAGRIQMDALAAAGAAPSGRLELQASQLSGQAIVGRADQAIRLGQVSAVAGGPGRRGLVQLETAPAADPPEGPGPGGRGVIKVADTRLEGLRVQLRSGALELTGSEILAPKGMIHLEAQAGDLAVAASLVDVGVRSVADLRTPVNRRQEVAGVILNEALQPPSVGLFAAANLRVLDGSRIAASQEVEALRRTNPNLGRDDRRLTDTSGNVVLDAGQALTIGDSRIEADATDNLAGNLLLRSQATSGVADLTLDHAWLSASGGAGSGDIRLSSANGMVLRDSRLLAQSDRIAADMNHPTQPNWDQPFSGGEITLTNSSTERGIAIVNSQLRAEQSGRAGLLSPESLNGQSDGLPFKVPFQDLYDATDFGRSSLGGIVNLITAGGLSLAGQATLVSVDSGAAEAGPLDSLGGSIRIANFAPESVALRDGARLSSGTGAALSPAAPARAGELIQLDPAPIPVPAASWQSWREPNPYLLQPGFETLDQLFTGGDAGDSLPDEIRRRVQPPPEDLVIPVDGPPRPLQPPSLAEPRLPREADGPAPAPPPSPPIASMAMAAPAVTPQVRLTSAIGLALASPATGPGVALQLESSQAIPESEAIRAFQRTEQEAAQSVSAALGLQAPAPRSLEIAALQQQLRAGSHAVAAILQISRTPLPGTSLVQINHVLIPSSGDIRGWQTRLDGSLLQRAIEAFQRQLSQQAAMAGPGAGEQLSAVLLEPVLPELQRLGVTTLLLALDRGLQGIPFAALPVPAGGSLIDRLAITITPALSLTTLAPPSKDPGPRRTLLAGASRFRNGLAPLPMASQELRQLAALHPDALVLLDQTFQTRAVIEQTRTHPVDILHLATHADFDGQRADAARIYTGDGELSLKELGRELRRNRSSPLGLFVLNACRTAVGDEQRELGMAGLALQAGASAALGNLWYVDDVVTAAFSVQFHRALQQGLRSDEALRHTQRLFRQGAIHVRGDQIVTADGAILLSGLSRADQARLAQPLDHPYYWAGAILSGRSW